MNEANKVTISDKWDLEFFCYLADPLLPYSHHKTEAGYVFSYSGEDYEKFQAAIANYPTAYLSITQGKAKARIVEKGKQIVENFKFAGMTIKLDYITEARITSAVVYLDRNPDVAEVNWDRGNCEFVTLTRDQLLALGDAAGAQVQAVFNKRKELADRVEAAEDINDPVFAEIEEEWFPEPEVEE